ncbi:hypothetical protein DP148_26235 [Salmonella enterica subsp. enterica serovar Typhimurium]|nr:hypothetical protein DP148_26235 [Salmonella enterica subsp. enterica serovar Typhimurium]
MGQLVRDFGAKITKYYLEAVRRENAHGMYEMHLFNFAHGPAVAGILSGPLNNDYSTLLEMYRHNMNARKLTVRELKFAVKDFNEVMEGYYELWTSSGAQCHGGIFPLACVFDIIQSLDSFPDEVLDSEGRRLRSRWIQVWSQKFDAQC